MNNNQIAIEVIGGKLSAYSADAYVLPFLPYHESISEVRLEVAKAGAAGVYKFVDHRLRNRRLRLGDVIIVDSEGGRSRKLINMVCRLRENDLLDMEFLVTREEQMKYALHNGFISMLLRAPEYGIKHIAMPPLCVSDKLPVEDFARALKTVLNSYPSPHSVERITVHSEDDRILVRLQKEFA